MLARDITWTKLATYPVRTCRSIILPDPCALCTRRIVAGQRYHDGDYHRRAHVDCVEKSRAWAERQAKKRETLPPQVTT